MKLLVLLLVVIVVIWLARARRRSVATRDPRTAHVPPQEEMVACSHCGVHLPHSEALPGRGGIFCTEAHRAAFEQAHP